jgi:toxin ParE1/3/4
VLSYKLTKKADEDLVHILDYGIDNFGIEKAVLFYHDLSSYLNLICNNPQQYPYIGAILPNYRRAVFKSYSIFFIVRDEFVEISRVLRKELLQPSLFE